jgi:hypothetical protein
MDEEKRDIFGELITVDPDGQLPATASDMLAGLANVSQGLAMSAGSGGLNFLGLSRSGVWQYGAENIRVSPDAELAVDLRSLKHGFSSWDDGKLLGEIMVAASEQLPLPSSLPQTGADWSQSVSVEVLFVSGSDNGLKVLYKTNSLGGRRAVMAMIDSIKRQAQADPSKVVPVIRLRASSYQHKKYGEIFTPILEIVRWIDPRAGRPTPVTAAPKQAPLAGAAVDDVLPAAQPVNAGRRRRVGA